jgi:hypothetical protein
MEKNLPLYELFIDENDESGVDFIALVDEPAIQKGWKAFAAEKPMKFSADVEKRIISGPAMVPDQLIYRKDKDGNGYNVIFRTDTIRKIVEKYFRNQNNGNFNLMHRKNLLAEGVYLIESMLIDEQRGIRTPLGFEKLKDGSWFISCKVQNDQVWDDYVKTGVFTGFSVEGIFLEKKVSNANKQLDEVLSILAQIN